MLSVRWQAALQDKVQAMTPEERYLMMIEYHMAQDLFAPLAPEEIETTVSQAINLSHWFRLGE